MNGNIDNLSKNEYIAKRYAIRITHKAQKNLETMPKREQERFFRLKMGCMLEKRIGNFNNRGLLCWQS